ncbi:lasso RiPP family leader peptide-containing protein [Erythrobacter sp. EC-HK427]|nr:lasso RiPP family leader peptide-containing protein [Erythrobacter sp. EC-HK427]VVT02221.1 conserved hypothetical protein [Erythrobacter sp. EC-HK427]
MKQPMAKKARYERPVLTVFGSVRNLTGGSGGMLNGDSTSMDML